MKSLVRGGAVGLALFALACGGQERAAPVAPAASGLASEAAAVSEVAPPDTPEGRQLAWVLTALRERRELSDAELGEHFDAGFLAQVPAQQVRGLFSSLAGLGEFTLVEARSELDGLHARVRAGDRQLLVRVAVDGAGVMRGLLFRPADLAPPPSFGSLGEFAAALEPLAPRTAFLAAQLEPGGRCAPLHEARSTVPMPIGSAFKLYVLLALADAVRAGELEWDTPLQIREQWKSLPSGELQNVPDGQALPLREYAAKMIAISDNTATDHLIYRLGRERVEAALLAAEHSAPERNRPFLTTRELFVLKLGQGGEAERYLALAPEQRRAYLDGELAGRTAPPLSDPKGWSEPRYTDELEWFASPADLCRLLSVLASRAQDPRGAALLEILSANPGLPVDRARWPFVGFKGGSEPGVMNLTWLLRRADGRWFATSASWNDPSAPLDEARILHTAGGLFGLLAEHGG